ncbi:hypothetical protein COW36_11875 [bacterium (Candidatus Blackallbacteria) CG17_big_fil_post_rev_8_21_14_2_50_48_46]|uniref:DUF3108 domain-containing protein n=1 Tax=bacterium (Candidatus Blackallbacteria) CG17_big_fil_post_rev_8_21_14_2_50_48_46 TaxID=2014261 RepID=A0A2M7G3W4_9BACT|nr:MAG: hypothetical protein COW64_03385 [bacterium (Candidatus Blackallbacteria) CG18_big_fil_WC_8_21_14_2_50_49_26]PIW16461.1 MAG: hypothetical protein COW36_11875 [bacterium (Candidatus Blackallbacteria) CG17_big_fil_post_rev_8_21_14_2_50_48_46]PIW45969.1 MAG: hypothetical protein COW20_17140 [bacterium (Candidatus Blackallbacteria) CG13_big_fil_rev_8_21_14_2_50_49_14]
MRRSLIFSALFFLSACQATLAPNPVSRSSVKTLSASEIKRYYPLEAGRSWTFSLEQSQNDQPNTKFKTMIMRAEPLGVEGEAETAVLRRSYPDSDIKPTPTLVKRFADRVELSRYHEQVLRESFKLPEAEVRGVNFLTAMQLPFQAGKAWEGRVFNGGTETIQVMGFETVTVPAGTFQALKIEHHLRYENGKEDYLRYWYAPDLGMVKLYEELTFYYGQWLKFRSTGVLTQFTPPSR